MGRATVGKRISRFVLALVLAGTAAMPAAASAKVPRSFIGMDVSATLSSSKLDLKQQVETMRRSGVATVRLPVYWSQFQPFEKMSQVPPSQTPFYVSEDGHPTAWAGLDYAVGQIVDQGMRPLLVVLNAPPWARIQPTHNWSPPKEPTQYGQFVGALARRYGSRGTFYKGHPAPKSARVRWYQIWNEPAGGDSPGGTSRFWDGPRPFTKVYFPMLRASRKAVRRADPKGKILLSGFFNRSWRALRYVYKKGGRKLFDGAAAHPFTAKPEDVVRILYYNRRIMNAHKDRKKPLLATEISYLATNGQIQTPGLEGVSTTDAGQAAKLRQVYTLLAKYRRKLGLESIFWYSWIGLEPNADAFEYGGLFRTTAAGKVTAKPAYSAFKSVVKKLRR